MSIYTDNGYKNRRDYLACLANDFGVPYEAIAMLAGMLGPNEDFDGLVTSVEDYAEELMEDVE